LICPGWRARFYDVLVQVVAPALVRPEPPAVSFRQRARSYLFELVSELERKNGWTLAEAAEDVTDGMRNAFPAAMNETALDHYQARKHVARYGHVTLSMCACARLAVTAAASRRPLPAGACGGGPGGEGGTCDASERSGDHAGGRTPQPGGPRCSRNG
jgi:hypothetical protein